MRKALVTGGAGFIGSHLTSHLLQNGFSVRVLDNLSTGNKANLSEYLQDIDFIQGDIRDISVVEKSLQGIEVVFHLAAQISVAESMIDPAKCFDINVTGTQLLLQKAAEASVEKVVISSSAAVYGEQEVMPVNEDATLRPLSPYAASKQIDEVLGGLYSRSYNLSVICLRYFNVFGTRQDPNSSYAAAIPIFIQRMLAKKAPILYGDGSQTRDFIYVSDVARANMLAVNKGPDSGAIMNICTGKQISVLDLLHQLQELIPGTPDIQMQPARSGDIYRSFGDPQLAKRLISFENSVEFQEGLARTIEWMKK